MLPHEVVKELSRPDQFPEAAIADASERRREMAPIFIERIETYVDTPPDQRIEDTAIFMMVHLLAQWREATAYRAIARLFRFEEHELDDLMGDSVTEHTHKILAALFDGDPQPIFDIIHARTA